MTPIEELQKSLFELTVQKAQLEMRAANEMWHEAMAKRKQAEEALEEYRQTRELDKNRRRPCRELWVDITYNDQTKQWSASHQGIVAYGDTPEMACANFDHLWIYGHDTDT